MTTAPTLLTITLLYWFVLWLSLVHKWTLAIIDSDDLDDDGLPNLPGNVPADEYWRSWAASVTTDIITNCTKHQHQCIHHHHICASATNFRARYFSTFNHIQFMQISFSNWLVRISLCDSGYMPHICSNQTGCNRWISYYLI